MARTHTTQGHGASDETWKTLRTKVYIWSFLQLSDKMLKRGSGSHDAASRQSTSRREREDPLPAAQDHKGTHALAGPVRSQLAKASEPASGQVGVCRTRPPLPSESGGPAILSPARSMVPALLCPASPSHSCLSRAGTRVRGPHPHPAVAASLSWLLPRDGRVSQEPPAVRLSCGQKVLDGTQSRQKAASWHAEEGLPQDRPVWEPREAEAGERLRKRRSRNTAGNLHTVFTH